MNPWMMLSIATLMINVVLLLLLIIHMRRFQHLNHNFNKVMNNVQSYLAVVMEDGEDTSNIEREPSENDELEMQSGKDNGMSIKGFADVDARMKSSQRNRDEELLGQVLGDIFS